MNQANNKMSPLPNKLYREHLPTAAVQNTAGCEKKYEFIFGQEDKNIEFEF